MVYKIQFQLKAADLNICTKLKKGFHIVMYKWRLGTDYTYSLIIFRYGQITIKATIWLHYHILYNCNLLITYNKTYFSEFVANILMKSS